MTTASKLQALVDGLEDTRQAIEGKGATLPAGSPLGDYPGAVESIESGGGDPWVPPPPTNVTDMSNMFRGWSWLDEVPLFDTSNVTDMTNMFNGCSSLGSVPLFDTSNVTDMGNMFSGCSSLGSVPLFDTSNVTTMRSMFDGCSSLGSVPLFDTSNVTDMRNMFNGCSSLVEVELTDCSKVTIATNMFGTTTAGHATSLERLTLPGMTRGFNLRNTKMGASALNDFFHSLGTASGSQTITITGAPGAAECDKTIATTKGWTITG